MRNDLFTIFQPTFLERLADSLRLPQVVPSIQAQVFLCFRVLLLRMSPQHVTSLWPVIVSELVQVFLHIEQELSTDTEQFRWVFHSWGWKPSTDISFSVRLFPLLRDNSVCVSGIHYVNNKIRFKIYLAFLILNLLVTSLHK